MYRNNELNLKAIESIATKLNELPLTLTNFCLDLRLFLNRLILIN